MNRPKDTPVVIGVYAIQGPAGVYVGQSADINRRVGQFASRLGLAWGIVRELPKSTRKERHRVEAEVTELFRVRGFNIVSITAYEVGLLAGHQQSLESRRAAAIKGAKSVHDQLERLRPIFVEAGRKGGAKNKGKKRCKLQKL